MDDDPNDPDYHPGDEIVTSAHGDSQKGKLALLSTTDYAHLSVTRVSMKQIH